MIQHFVKIHIEFLVDDFQFVFCGSNFRTYGLNKMSQSQFSLNVLSYCKFNVKLNKFNIKLETIFNRLFPLTIEVLNCGIAINVSDFLYMALRP